MQSWYIEANIQEYGYIHGLLCLQYFHSDIVKLAMSFMSNFCPNSTKQEDSQPQDLPSTMPVEHPQPESTDGWIHSTGQYWNITKAKYETEKWSDKWKENKYASARYIKLKQTGQWSILKQIAHINFTELRSLYLPRNGIATVEAIVHLKAPFLSNLDLRSNNICDIRSLRKIGSKLDHLFLASNPIKDYTPISQIHFHKKTQISYVVDFPNYFDQQYTIDSLRPFFKAEPLRVAGPFMLEMSRISTQEGSVVRAALNER